MVLDNRAAPDPNLTSVTQAYVFQYSKLFFLVFIYTLLK